MILILGVTIILFYYILIRPHKFWKSHGVQQGKPWILFGDIWPMIFRASDMAEMISNIYKSIPDVRYYGTYQFLKPKFVIRDPELINKVCVKDFDYFTDHVTMVDPKANPLFSKNLLNLKGDEWRKMRSTLSGSFTSSKMKIMFNLISDAAENFVSYFEKREDEGDEIEMKDAFTRFTVDVIATTNFGVKVDSLLNRQNEFFRMAKAISELNLSTVFKILLFQFSPWAFRFFGFEIFPKSVNDFFRNVVNETIKTRETKHIHRPDMIQILMEARKGIEGDEDASITKEGFAVAEEYFAKSKIPREITNEDITAQALIFFFAGFDSVSSLMTFITYELAVNNDAQKQLRKEILETLTKTDGKLTFEAISSMKYMDMVVSETLRKWPPFVIVGRQCTKSYVIEPTTAGERTLVVPKGMAVQIPAYAIHHDPKYYPDPEKFIPERFSPENRSRLTPHTLLGFGQGPRSCIGSRFALIEVKTIFFYLLSRFELVVTQNTQVPIKLSKKFSVNIRPEKGLWIQLKKLKQ